MRLNYKNWPVWEAIDARNGDSLFIHGEFAMEVGVGNIKAMSDLIQKMLTEYKKIRYVSDTFYDALQKIENKLPMDEIHTSNRDKPSETGIMLRNNYGVLYKTNVAIAAGPEMDIKMADIFGIIFDRWGVMGYGAISYLSDGKGLISGWTSTRGYNFENPNTKTNLHKELSARHLHDVLKIMYFMHNCEIEVRVWHPKEKTKIKQQKYFNETKSQIEIVDCTWFTELVRTTPFHVNGFFRWQPYGTGRSFRKLKWIEGFEKSGYRRKAKKETSHE